MSYLKFLQVGGKKRQIIINTKRVIFDRVLVNSCVSARLNVFDLFKTQKSKMCNQQYVKFVNIFD